MNYTGRFFFAFFELRGPHLLHEGLQNLDHNRYFGPELC